MLRYYQKLPLFSRWFLLPTAAPCNMKCDMVNVDNGSHRKYSLTPREAGGFLFLGRTAQKGRVFSRKGNAQVSQLSSDLLRVVRAISAEIGLSERIVYDHLVRGLIPGAKFGKIWTSSRSKLAKYYADRIDESIKGDIKEDRRIGA